MDEEDDIFENQVEFLAEKDAWNRVGGGADIGLGLGGAINLKKSGYSNEEKFKLIALSTINVLNDLDYDDRILSNPEITHMLSLVEKIPDYKYKNPSAFVMGYMVAKQSNYNTLEINKNMLQTVLDMNKKIEDELFSYVGDIDIIRYTRLCLLNKLK
jgi:hypothetical protein